MWESSTRHGVSDHFTERLLRTREVQQRPRAIFSSALIVYRDAQDTTHDELVLQYRQAAASPLRTLTQPDLCRRPQRASSPARNFAASATSPLSTVSTNSHDPAASWSNA